MHRSSIIQIAAHGWPELVTECATAKPASEERLSAAPLWQIDASGRLYALRGWRPEQYTQAERVSSLLHRVYQPESLVVPVPIGVVAGGNEYLVHAAGLLWELTPWLPGCPCDATDITSQHVESACDKLALLHMRAKGLPSSEWRNSTSLYLARVAELERQLADGNFEHCDGSNLIWWPFHLPRPAEALGRAVRQVRGQYALLDFNKLPVQLVWGDAWISNFLFDQQRAVGLVDFVTVRPDTPMADLARLLGSVSGPNNHWWRIGLAAYDSQRRLDDLEWQALGALYDIGTVLSLANWLRWLAVERRTFTNQAAAVSRAAHFARRLAALLELPATM